MRCCSSTPVGLGTWCRAPIASCPPKTSAASPTPTTPWRGEDADLKPYEDVPGFPPYGDVPGFCATADLDAIRDHDHVLIPGQYIGSEPVEGDGQPLDEKIARLTAGIGD
jgi:hypothetical protein